MEVGEVRYEPLDNMVERLTEENGIFIMIKISNSICIQQGFWCSKLLICCCVRFPTINWKIGGYRTDLITSCKNKHSLGSGIFCRQVEWYFRSVKICCGCRQHKCEPKRLWYFRISNDFQDYDTLWRYGSLRIIWGRDCSFFQCLACGKSVWGYTWAVGKDMVHR